MRFTFSITFATLADIILSLLSSNVKQERNDAALTSVKHTLWMFNAYKRRWMIRSILRQSWTILIASPFNRKNLNHRIEVGSKITCMCVMWLRHIPTFSWIIEHICRWAKLESIRYLFFFFLCIVTVNPFNDTNRHKYRSTFVTHEKKDTIMIISTCVVKWKVPYCFDNNRYFFYL